MMLDLDEPSAARSVAITPRPGVVVRDPSGRPVHPQGQDVTWSPHWAALQARGLISISTIVSRREPPLSDQRY